MKFVAISALLIATSTFAGAALAHGPGRWDANQDGKVTKDEARAAAAAFFTKLDANGDGAITKAEADAARAKHEERRAERHKEHGGKGPEGKGPEGKGPEGKGPHRDLFAEADANKDGKVTKAEAQAQADAHFAKLDTNKDGVITKEERPHHGKKDGEGKSACGPEKKAKSDSAA